MVETKLTAIQNELKVPKGRKNTFGNYNYRSLEDICEAVKPLLAKHNCSLRIQDYVREVGSRVYIEAIATLTDLEDGSRLTNSALAREAESKKGMDDSQVTGATSSYARKYCLNGLFLIDDTKDADSDEYATENAERYKKNLASEEDKTVFKQMCAAANVKASAILLQAGWKQGDDVTKDILASAIKIVAEIGNENDRQTN